MSSVLAPSVVQFVRGNTHRYAQCWRIVRKDGVILRFTSHNRRLSFKADGDPFEMDYEPAGGFSASARLRKADVEPNSIDSRGYLTSDAISHDDLRAGKFRNADVREYIVDWEYPFFGPIVSNRYILQDVRFDGETWDGTLASVVSVLETQVGRSYNRPCRYDLGDFRCTFDLSLVTITEYMINTAPTSRESFVSGSPGPTFDPTDHPTGHFDYGLITWVTGNNKDTQSEVRSYTFNSANGGTGIFTLQEPTQFDMQLGDIFDAHAGCDKVFNTCRDKFGALSPGHEANFGGFHLQPGRDRVQFPVR